MHKGWWVKEILGDLVGEYWRRMVTVSRLVMILTDEFAEEQVDLGVTFPWKVDPWL